MMLSTPSGASSAVVWVVPFFGIGLAMKGAGLGGQHGRQQIGEVRGVPAAIRQRELAAQQQQAAAAAIHELADQFLLGGREIAGFHRPDDQSLVDEQVLRRA